MSIYVATHKYLESYPRLSNDYKWLYVGAYRQKERQDGFCYDDIGENISERNSSFCELTGLYWIANNTEDEIKGLVHYRRFFTHRALSEKDKYFYTDTKIKKKLEKYDIIVPKRMYTQHDSIHTAFKRAHNIEDMDKLGQVIEELTPEYSEAFRAALDKKWLFPYNMFVTKKEIFDGYSSWLYKILTELEKRVDISGYNQYQSRLFGFLSERLLNVWIIHYNLRFKELPVVTICDSKRHRYRYFAEHLCRRSLYFNGRFSSKRK